MVTNNLQIDLVTDEDLTILNSLYADMNNKPLMSSAILDSVTILSSYRGQGYGKQMMQRALEISADAGCWRK